MKQKEKEAKKLSTSIKMSQRSVEMIKMVYLYIYINLYIIYLL